SLPATPFPEDKSFVNYGKYGVNRGSKSTKLLTFCEQSQEGRKRRQRRSDDSITMMHCSMIRQSSRSTGVPCGRQDLGMPNNPDTPYCAMIYVSEPVNLSRAAMCADAVA